LYEVRGGENVMRMSKRVSVGLLSIIFLVALVSAMPVEAKKGFSVHKWWSEVNMMDMTGHIWTGGPNGKYDGLRGTIHWDNQGWIFLGPDASPTNYVMQKFWGEWWIDFDLDDGIVDIRGTHKGIFNPTTSQSTVNGRITEATGVWSYLEGGMMHSIGYIEFPRLDYYLQINYSSQQQRLFSRVNYGGVDGRSTPPTLRCSVICPNIEKTNCNLDSFIAGPRRE
jgi:hypothetical protein